VELSRVDGTKENVIFQVRNNTGGDFTLTDMIVSWAAGTTAYYESVKIKIIDGVNYGTVWSYPPRAENGEKIALNPDPVIPAGETAEIEIKKFSKKKDKFKKKDMDDESFTITFFSGSTSYQTTVLVAGELLTLVEGWLKFRKQATYPSLITKYGDIIEQDSAQDKDRDFDGIIYSEKGKVQFENLKLEGCIVANEIELINSLDLKYKPKFVPDPPPDFISGMAFIDWEEEY
jgi:hypothetical protein